MIKIHHLNCISSCPLGGYLMDGETDSILKRGKLTCHCQLLETPEGLVLVDTGFGLQDVQHPHERLSEFFLALVSPEFREEMTAIRQIEKLGFRATDVKHIILTHLDFDHAGGLDDFPGATVHLSKIEKEYALQQKTWLDRQRFRPAQWHTQENWQVHDSTESFEWFGFQNARNLRGLSQDIVLVPLRGHTLGHFGVAIKQRDRFLFNVGDAYFYHEEMNFKRPYCTPGLRFYQWMLDQDRPARIENQKRLRVLKNSHGNEIDIFCSHDVQEFVRLAGRSPGVPAEHIVQSDTHSSASLL